MAIYTSYRTPYEMCMKVKEATGLRTKPWDRFHLETSEWWLLPSEAKEPTFRYGKFCFKKSGDSLCAGLYVEKGIDPSHAEEYLSPKGRTWIMREDGSWIWRRFHDDVKSGTLQGTIEQVAQATRLPMEIHVNGGYVTDSDADPDNFKNTRDEYILQVAGTRYKCTGEKTPGHGSIADYSTCKSDKDFTDLLHKDNGQGRTWVDIFVAGRFQIGKPTDGVFEEWNAQMIWDRLLKPFEQWFR